MLYIIQLCAENFEGEQLTEEYIFELMVDDQANDVGKPVETLVELGYIGPADKFFLIA